MISFPVLDTITLTNITMPPHSKQIIFYSYFILAFATDVTILLHKLIESQNISELVMNGINYWKWKCTECPKKNFKDVK